MSLRYYNKVAVVTGGSKGIGRGIVRVFGMKMSLFMLAVCACSEEWRTEHFCVFFCCSFIVENGAKVAFCGRES